MPPHCTKCDTINRESAIFCDRCGSRLELPKEEAQEKKIDPVERRDEENYTETAPRPEQD